LRDGHTTLDDFLLMILILIMIGETPNAQHPRFDIE